jgi:magnesium transporter
MRWRRVGNEPLGEAAGEPQSAVIRCYPDDSSGTAMLKTYPKSAGKLGDAICVDLFNPTDDEVKQVNRAFGIEVPARHELEEIESSSRLQIDDDTLSLSMPIVAHGDDEGPTPLGFVLTKNVLIIVRYSELRVLPDVVAALEKNGEQTSSDVMVRLIDAMVDFAADVLERIGSDLNEISRQAFRRYASQRAHNVARATRRLKDTLVSLGAAGEQLSQIRESILGLQRITGFAADKGKWIDAENGKRLKTASMDLQSLADFENHLSNKVQFLLDAVLGFINTEQNDIFKVLTIVSVVGIPPTLIASMYGMNFVNTPEYHWNYGYAWGLFLIVISAVLPTIWFKWRGWW